MDETKYGFGITIKLSDEVILTHEESFIGVAVSDNIQLRISSQHPPSGLISLNDVKPKSNQLPLNKSPLLTITSEGYASEKHATETGHKIIQALKLIAVKKRFGLITDKNQRIPSGSSQINPKLFKDILKDFEEVHLVDGSNFNLFIYPLNKELISVSGGGMSARVGYNSKDLEEDFKEMYPISNIILNPKEKLAIDLYLISKFEISIDARFLFLINVVECLKKDEKQDKKIVQYIDSVLEDVKKKFPDNESFYSRVKDLKELSIRQGCRKLVKKYLNNEDWKLFDKCYGIRSDLVHNGEASEPNTPGKYYSKLDELVSRLILSIIVAKKKSS